MATIAAHRQPAPPILTAGALLALRMAATIGGLLLVSFVYGTTGRNPFVDTATVVAGVWWTVTNPWTYVLVAVTALLVKHAVVLSRTRKGAHRA